MMTSMIQSHRFCQILHYWIRMQKRLRVDVNDQKDATSPGDEAEKSSAANSQPLPQGSDLQSPGLGLKVKLQELKRRFHSQRNFQFEEAKGRKTQFGLGALCAGMWNRTLSRQGSVQNLVGQRSFRLFFQGFQAWTSTELANQVLRQQRI